MNQQKILTIVDSYRTPFDHENVVYKQQQYEHGLHLAQDCTYIIISINGVWGAKRKDGSFISSYEKLGYHANTADLLQGWLDGGIEIRDARSALGYRTCQCGMHTDAIKFVQGKCPRCGKEALPNIEGSE